MQVHLKLAAVLPAAPTCAAPFVTADAFSSSAIQKSAACPPINCGRHLPTPSSARWVHEMEHEQAQCPELPASEGGDGFTLADEAMALFRRAEGGALRQALAARATELKFSPDTVLSQLLAQCFTQCAAHYTSP